MAELPKLFGKVALITGAGNGIGAATAKLFTKLGATVSLLDLDENSLKTTSEECEKLICHDQPKPLLTVGSVADANVRAKYVEDTANAFSKIDILINNAGITKFTSLLESSLDEFDKIFDINVKAVIHMTQLSAPHLIKTKGCVVNIASVAAHRVMDGRLYYGLSKACVKHFTLCAAEELAKHQVRVNCVSPGLINTNIFLSYHVTKDELPKYLEQSGKKHALSRCGEPSEIAQTIAFLSSDESSFMTGSDVLVDGGFLVQPAAAAQVD
ncbi:hypothetical protein CHUAL_009267 [Chamberlinius hualienensis]